MTPVIFTVPGKPHGKQRHRVSTAQKRAYDTAANRSHARTVGMIARPHFPRPMVGPVCVSIDARFAIPKSWSREKTLQYLGEPHTQKPDADNIAKAICDALNGIAWADDAQVGSLSIVKAWGEGAVTFVTIERGA